MLDNNTSSDEVNVELFIQAVVSGASVGSIYALVALGIVLLYRSTRILNFAHGEIGALTTFIAFVILRSLGLPYPLTFFLTLAAALLIGAVIYLLVVRPAKNQSELGLIILTLGMALTLGGFDAVVFGTDNKAFPPLITDSNLMLANASVSSLALFTALIGLVIMLALWLLLNFTKLGLAMRAVAQSEEICEALGIPVRRALMATWAVAALLAGGAAMLFAPTTLLNPSMMFDPVNKGFVAAVLGGLNSLPGAVVGGYILGVAEVLLGTYISLKFKASFAFLVVLIVLIFRPHGLLGKAEVKRV